VAGDPWSAPAARFVASATSAITIRISLRTRCPTRSRKRKPWLELSSL
jgi:hypothetical protein